MKSPRRRRGGRGGRGRGGRTTPSTRPKPSLWSWLRSLFAGAPAAPAPRAGRVAASTGEQEARALAEFSRHFRVTFRDPELLKLALTHRSYLSVTGQGPRESNERLEFLGDSVLGLVTSEFLYREHPTEHEGQLTKSKSLLVSKAILSRRALQMGLGRFVLMSHSEVESGGRQRLSILADAFEAVIGAIYLDQGFEAARAFIQKHLLREAREISADKRHTNYKSHLQEYVQSHYRTHPVYRIRSEVGPDHSKQFVVEVMVGRRSLGEGKGHNKKDAEQAAARDALEQAGAAPGADRPRREAPVEEPREVRAPRSRRAAAIEDDVELREPRRTRRDVEDDDHAVEARRRPRRSRDDGREAAPVAEAEPRAGREREDSGARGRSVRPIAVSEPARPPAAAPSRIRPTESHEAYASHGAEAEPLPAPFDEDENEEIGRPEGTLEDRHVDVYAFEDEPAPGPSYARVRDFDDRLPSAPAPPRPMRREREPEAFTPPVPRYEPEDEPMPRFESARDEPDAPPAREVDAARPEAPPSTTGGRPAAPTFGRRRRPGR